MLHSVKKKLVVGYEFAAAVCCCYYNLYKVYLAWIMATILQDWAKDDKTRDYSIGAKKGMKYDDTTTKTSTLNWISFDY